MRIVCLSDTHWFAPPRHVHLDGDIIIHAGDGTEWGGFTEWVDEFNVLAVSGNHDAADLPLNDREVVVNGLRIYGMPWTPRYGNWHYMLPRDSDELKAKVEAIPSGLDILVTHGPPFGRMDRERGSISLGCELLASHLKSICPPKLHVFGHIHGGYGVRDYRDCGDITVLVNAAICDPDYRPVNKPIVIDL